MNDTTNWLQIPWQKLSADALTGMLEDLASRDGTDYGEQECSLDEKVAGLRRSLEQGNAHVVWCQETDTWAILDSEQINSRSS